MRYLGGKTRLAKKIVAEIRARGGIAGWEPFCGGGSVTCELATLGPLIASDAHPALMAMWRALQAGWEPPAAVTREEHRKARELPDTDPLKAFIGFGASFGGDYFCGYTPGDRGDGADTTRRVLLRQAARLASVRFEHVSFFDVPIRVQPPGAYIYCDPPYAGTSPYRGAPSFDHEHFWLRCREWARECPVYVSEFTAPVDVECIAEFPRKKAVASGNTGECIDRLYLVR